MAAALTDEQVIKMAKARVGFKVHFMVYVLVNLFLMAIWMMGSAGDWMTGTHPMDGYYWPMWTHLGWGLGVAIHGFMVYGPGNNMLAREEEKIRQQMGK